MLLIANEVDAVVVWFARQCLQMAVELLCQGDDWKLEIVRNPMFSRIKWLPASMGGTEPQLCDGRGSCSVSPGRVLHCKVEFRCADRTVIWLLQVCVFRFVVASGLCKVRRKGSEEIHR